MKKKHYYSPAIIMNVLPNTEVLFVSPANPNLNDIYESDDWNV
jgi:hypothetical protein